MEIVNFSAILVAYNFVIGVLIVLSSEKLGLYAGHLVRLHRAQATRVTRLATFTFGLCVAVLSAGIYVAFFMLKL